MLPSMPPRVQRSGWPPCRIGRNSTDCGGLVHPVMAKKCIVKHWDEIGIEHSLTINAESLYEAAVIGIARLCPSDLGGRDAFNHSVRVEIHEEPTVHCVDVKKLEAWLRKPGRSPMEEIRKNELRKLLPK